MLVGVVEGVAVGGWVDCGIGVCLLFLLYLSVCFFFCVFLWFLVCECVVGVVELVIRCGGGVLMSYFV